MLDAVQRLQRLPVGTADGMHQDGRWMADIEPGRHHHHHHRRHASRKY